jgi:ATP-binding cassette subfamily B protein
MQFVGSFFVVLGAGIFLLALNFKLGLVALAPSACVLIVTKIISEWVRRTNKESLNSLGAMSAEIQESVNNFKVIGAFNRQDYFRKKFEEANNLNFKSSVGAGIANNVFTPIYGLASNAAQLVVLVYGIYLISTGSITIGLLIGFLLYVNNFYTPLRQLASVWSALQLALASFDRISEILSLKSNLLVVPSAIKEQKNCDVIMEFKDVSFSYPGGENILKNIGLKLERGKTYALVGPTGGGKTTTASLMARLFDPTDGGIILNGRDIKSYTPEDRAKIIGFILQEPFLFTGTVRDNILYGNSVCQRCTESELEVILKETNLLKLVKLFRDGLDTKILTSGDAISLGQKQIIAFMRVVLRKPDLLILDEATANIDTMTEKLLEEILNKLPKETTKVIIAHRLNTIDRADEICFINSGEIVAAGSMEHAISMLLHGKRTS